MTNYLAHPSSPRGGILVLHAWWGLNDFFKGFCERLTNEGYIVLAPNLYNGAVAATIPEAEKLRSKMKRAVVSKQILGALNELKAKADALPLGLIGFSLGAHWGLWLAQEKPKAFDATVLFYGARGGDYAKSRAAYLGHFAEADDYVSESGRKKLEKSLRASGKEVAFHVYPETRHWFFESDRPEFNKDAAGLAWERTVEFLKENLAGE